MNTTTKQREALRRKVNAATGDAEALRHLKKLRATFNFNDWDWYEQMQYTLVCVAIAQKKQGKTLPATVPGVDLAPDGVRKRAMQLTLSGGVRQ
jgi:hypothetical protein